jgi:hypothetical protein
MKKVWRENNAKYYLFELNSDSQQEKQLTEFEKDCPIVKISIQEFKESLQSLIDNPKDDFSENFAKSRLGAVEALEKYLVDENIAYTEK